MRFAPLFLAVAALLDVAPLAAGQADLVDRLLARYTRPRAAAGPDAIHLLYLARIEQTDTTKSYYHQYTPAKGWSEENTFSGHLDVAFFDRALYVFRRENYTVYTDEDWRTTHWPFSWLPSAVCQVGEELWVFGSRSAADKHRIRAARFAKGEGGAAVGPTAFGGRLDLPRRAYDLCVMADGKSARVFWHHQGTGEEATNEVWHATYDGELWSRPERVPAPYAFSDFAAVVHEGKVWLFSKERGRRISDTWPLKFITLEGASWSAPAVVPQASDARLDWTFDMDALSFDGALYLFRACRHRVVVHRWRGGHWLEPEAVIQVPPWASYVFWWSLANGMACLALIPVVAWCAFRVRGQRKQATLPDGRVFTVATWSRRTAALLMDFFISEFIWFGIAALFSLGQDEGVDQLAALPALVLLHVVVYFAYFAFSESARGQTIGKRLLNIVVMTRDGKRPSARSIVIRNLVRPWLPLVPVAYVVGSLLLFLTPVRQRLGDLLAGTIVVDAPRATESPSGRREP